MNTRSMKCFLLVACLFSLPPVLAQNVGISIAQPSQPASNAASPTGLVTGRVICGDTDAPGRFANVQLIPEKPERLGVSEMGGAFPKDAEFAKAMTTVMSALLKGSSLSALSGIDGAFSLDNVPVGTYYVVATLPGYQSPLNQFTQAERMKADANTLKTVESVAQKIIVQPDQAVRVEIRLERGASLSGSVHYDDGSPAAGVTPILMLWQKDGKWKDLTLSTIPSVTDDRGRFRFFGLPAGKYAVKAALPTMQASMGIGANSLAMHMNPGDALLAYSGNVLREKDIKPVEVASGDDIDGLEVVFPLNGLHSISGAVVAKTDGHAINSGTIMLLDLETKAEIRTAILDAEGNFRFNYVVEGQYVLKVTGAADTELAEGASQMGDFGRMVGAKRLKAYAETEMPLTVKNDLPTLTVQVSDQAAKTSVVAGAKAETN